MQRFSDIKQGFRQICADPHWLAKIILGGCLLINPVLIVAAPLAIHNPGSPWEKVVKIALMVNVLTFWFPLGFTFEVLRRARTGRGAQLPDWRVDLLPRYAKEGAVKFLISITMLILPVVVWLLAGFALFVSGFGLPMEKLDLLAPPILLFAIPLCAVACCRWLDGACVWSCTLNYAENLRLLRKALPDYLVASAFLVGLNAITMSFACTIPFAVIFGLCVADTWFGPIYADTVADETPMERLKFQP